MTGEASEFLYQCKSGSRPDIYGALAEAHEAARPVSKTGVAAINRMGRGDERLAVLSWADWLDIARRLTKE